MYVDSTMTNPEYLHRTRFFCKNDVLNEQREREVGAKKEGNSNNIVRSAVTHTDETTTKKMQGLRKVNRDETVREKLEWNGEQTRWPWSLTRLAEKETARSSSSSSSSSSLRSGTEHEIDSSSLDAASDGEVSPGRGLQFDMEMPWFPPLPPAQGCLHPKPYGRLLTDGSIVFFDGTHVSPGNKWSKLKWVDEVDYTRKDLIVNSLGVGKLKRS